MEQWHALDRKKCIKQEKKSSSVASANTAGGKVWSSPLSLPLPDPALAGSAYNKCTHFPCVMKENQQASLITLQPCPLFAHTVSGITAPHIIQ